ncbi:hypothetical protein [Pseudomonas sp. S2_H10]
MALPETSAWRVESLRFSFFFAEQQDGRSKDWWKGFTGAEPEAAVNKPQMGEYTEAGVYNGGQLELKVAFNRIDWVWSFPFVGMPGLQMSQSTPNIDEAIRIMIQQIEGWLVTAGANCLRIAFGATLLMPVESVREGNVNISAYLPFFNLNPESAADVFVQINVPSVTPLVNGLSVNNITKWAVIGGQFMQMMPGGFPQIVTNNLLRCEFDLSTAADRAEVLPQGKLHGLFMEMIDFSKLTLKAGVRQ